MGLQNILISKIWWLVENIRRLQGFKLALELRHDGFCAAEFASTSAQTKDRMVDQVVPVE